MNSRPVVLNYGLGVDSTAILLRWLHEPSSRVINGEPFQLDQLVVITAMTGDEWESTGELVEVHILPLLRQHGVRMVQVARSDYSARAGVTVLDDSTSPKLLYFDGDFPLSNELLRDAIVPMSGQGLRHCSEKQKGSVIAKALPSLLGTNEYFNVIGFDSTELSRIKRASKFIGSDNRITVYPLMEWGWDRTRSIAYIKSRVGVEWPKSACVFCPFAFHSAGGRLKDPAARTAALVNANAELFDRYLASPRSVVRTLSIEYGARCVNPTQTLRVSGSAYDLFQSHGGFGNALEQFENLVNNTPHKLMDVRRVMRSTRRGDVYRSITTLTTDGSRPSMITELRRQFGESVYSNGVTYRADVIIPANKAVLPWAEQSVVVVPEWVKDKHNPSFASRWHEVTGEHLGLTEDSPCVEVFTDSMF